MQLLYSVAIFYLASCCDRTLTYFEYLSLSVSCDIISAQTKNEIKATKFFILLETVNRDRKGQKSSERTADRERATEINTHVK